MVRLIRDHYQWSLLGGAIAAGFVLLVGFLIGNVSGYEALTLMEVLHPTTRFMCSSAMTVSATILALMLTLLGLSRSAEIEFSASYYRRIILIAGADTVAFVVSTMLLLLLAIPVKETDQLPTSWFPTIYYLNLTGGALVAGVLITVVLMLFVTIRDMFYVLGLGGEAEALRLAKQSE